MPITALLALTLIAPQAGAGQAGTFVVNGKQIPLRLTSTAIAAPTPEFLAWDGWQYLQAPATSVFTPYRVLNNWADVLKQLDAVKETTGRSWRTKIFVLSRTETMERDANGVWRINRDIADEARVQETLEAIARVKAWISAEFGGKVEFVPDVEVETDTIRWDDLGSEFAQWYVGPRINGGSYLAEDKVFRGPYNSAIYILPGYRDQVPAPTIVNRTPVAAVAANVKGMAIDAGSLEAGLRAAWLSQVDERLKAQGYEGFYKSGDPAEVADPWGAATSLEEPSADALVQRLREGRGVKLSGEALDPATPSWRAPNAEVAVVDDSERAKVLKVSENPKYRSGGVGLPVPSGAIGAVDANPTLSLFAKSSDRDPISIRVQGKDGKAFWVSLGRDPILAKPTDAVVGSAAFEDNGQWQKIAVDLRPLAKEAGVTEIVGLAIEPSPNALKADMIEFGNAEYVFDDIKLSSEPAQPLLGPIVADFASADWEARALAASKATSSSPELLAALKDPSYLARLNATVAYRTIKDVMAESALVYNTGDLYSQIQATALEALNTLGSEAAKNQMRQVIRFTLGDYAKATAARLLAETKDLKYTGDILLLFTNPSWQTKLAGVDALAAMKVEPRARHGFLRNDNPIIRLQAVRLTDAKNKDDLSRLQWHSVNDPSDLVRAAAYIKLIESGQAVEVEDGYKGVRDDSYFVRVLLLDYLRTHPTAGNRKAIDLALADRFAVVRAAALSALAEQPWEVADDEISTLFADKYPDVQLALANLATKKKVKLPEATVTAMRTSPDKRVVEAARGFG